MPAWRSGEAGGSVMEFRAFRPCRARAQASQSMAQIPESRQAKSKAKHSKAERDDAEIARSLSTGFGSPLLSPRAHLFSIMAPLAFSFFLGSFQEESAPSIVTTLIV